MVVDCIAVLFVSTLGTGCKEYLVLLMNGTFTIGVVYVVCVFANLLGSESRMRVV